MANMADITTAAASDPDSPRESAPPPRGRASPSPSLPPSSPFPSLACPPTLSAARPERAQPRAAGARRRGGGSPLAGRRLAMWQVPGARLNPRPRACASASAARLPAWLGAPEEGAGQNTASPSSACVHKSVIGKGSCLPSLNSHLRACTSKALSSQAPRAPAHTHPPIRTSPRGAKGPFRLLPRRGADLPGLARPENASAVAALYPASTLRYLTERALQESILAHPSAHPSLRGEDANGSAEG